MNGIPSSCAPFDADLSALLDGELTPDREREVRAHVAECGRCAGRLDQLRAVDEVLGALAAAPVAPEVGAAVRDRVRREAGRTAPRRRRRAPRLRRWVPAAVGAVAAAGLVALVLLDLRSEGPVPMAAREPVPERAGSEPSRIAEAVPPHPAPGPDAGAPAPAPPPTLDEVSDEEIELALALEHLGGEGEIREWELIENLDLLEKLEALEARGSG